MKQGLKNDIIDNKLRWDLLPLETLEEVIKVYTAGSNKYGDNRWQLIENAEERYYGAMMRHLVEYRKGNSIDEDTGCLHIAQVVWNAITLLWFELRKKK